MDRKRLIYNTIFSPLLVQHLELHVLGNKFLEIFRILLAVFVLNNVGGCHDSQ